MATAWQNYWGRSECHNGWGQRGWKGESLDPIAHQMTRFLFAYFDVLSVSTIVEWGDKERGGEPEGGPPTTRI